MKTIHLAFAFCAVAGAVFPARAEWKHEIQLPSDAANGRLVVAGLNGDLTIEGIDGDMLTISSPDFEPPEAPEPKESRETEGLRSLLSEGADNSGVGLEINVDGANVNVVAVRPHESADFTFRVPRRMSLQVAGVIRGDVSVKGIAGEMEIVATEGDVRIEDAAAPVVVHAVNGDVDVTFSAFPKDRPASINAVNGTVRVEMPEGAAADLDLRTVNGDIFTDLPVEVKNRRVTNWGGPKAVDAKLNGGGAKLTINAVNDDVIVRGPKSP